MSCILTGGIPPALLKVDTCENAVETTINMTPVPSNLLCGRHPQREAAANPSLFSPGLNNEVKGLQSQEVQR